MQQERAHRQTRQRQTIKKPIIKARRTLALLSGMLEGEEAFPIAHPFYSVYFKNPEPFIALIHLRRHIMRAYVCN